MRAYPYLIGVGLILLMACAIMASRREEFKEWEEEHIRDTGLTYEEAGVE